MKRLVVILTVIVTSLSVMAGCVTHQAQQAKQNKQRVRHKYVSRLHTKMHLKGEPAPDIQTYGMKYVVNPDGSWQYYEDPTPTPEPTAAPKKQSF